jgi:hypothetical protein
LLTYVACLFALMGCASLGVREMRPSVDQQLSSELPLTIRTLETDHRFLQLSSTAVAERLRTLHPGEPLNILALSGGGATGAFGAGAVAGLTRSGSRPDFAVVTGVSAGALVAPYAFLGPTWDTQLIDAFTSGTAEHLLRTRGLGALFGSSWYSGRPLKQLVAAYASDAMIEAVAHEADKGRGPVCQGTFASIARTWHRRQFTASRRNEGHRPTPEPRASFAHCAIDGATVHEITEPGSGHPGVARS